MPISEEADYADALDAFRAKHVPSRGTAGVVEAYRAVQAMPYRSVADRRPVTALRNHEGACTAKHLILRDLLRAIGEEATTEIIEGDFASGIPVVDTMTEELVAMIREGGVIDLHCRVRLGGGAAPRYLDATFSPALERFGFTVDRDWNGEGDTRQAIDRVTVRSDDEDVLATKARLLAGFSPDMTQRRLDFLRLLTAWLARVETQ